MSSALAIASVSYVLKDLLNNGFIDSNISGITMGNVNVTALPPDKIDVTADEPSRLNIYLYRVSFNQGWKNFAFPSRDSRGDRVSNPPLAIDLHYLLTCYGSSELHTEILLGYGMQILHENPVLSRDQIRKSLLASETESSLPETLRMLSSSGLAEQVEQIKIIPENMAAEEISKMWTAFGAKYRPSAAYQVSVVLIESRTSYRSGLPVKKPLIYVDPFQRPVIEKIKSRKDENADILENQPITPGCDLVICGHYLKGDEVVVKAGSLDINPLKKNISDRQIIISLTSDLKAGLQSVYVIHKKKMGDPPVAHKGMESNPVSFVLLPSITSQPEYETDPILNTGQFTVNVNPPLHERQNTVLFLNELKDDPYDSVPPYFYSFSLPGEELANLANPVSKVVFPVSKTDKMHKGEYLVRIQVDGAMSLPEQDMEGNYATPIIKIE
jgi:hypothetical protein